MTEPSSKYIDRIENWLKELGLGPATERVASSRLRVNLKTGGKTTSRYRLYFEHKSDDIIFESLVFKAATGDPAKVEGFLKALLAFNGAVIGPTIAFGFIRIEPQKWRVSLKGSQECKRFDKDYLRRVLDVFDEAYSEHIPALKELATENVEFGDAASFLDLWTKENFPESDLE